MLHENASTPQNIDERFIEIQSIHKNSSCHLNHFHPKMVQLQRQKGHQRHKCTCLLCGRWLKLVIATSASHVMHRSSQWPASPPTSPASSHWPICGVGASCHFAAKDIVLGNATLSGWPSFNHGKGNSHHRHATHGSHQRHWGKLMKSRNTHEWSEFRRRSPRWGSVRGCECARHLNVFDVCAGVSCYSPSDS